jgi:hypothetical protein
MTQRRSILTIVQDHFGNRSTSNEAVRRFVIWVSQNPLAVTRHEHGEMPKSESGTMSWVSSSTVQGLQQVSPQGTFTVLREDDVFFDYQPTRLAIEKLGLEHYTLLEGSRFDDFVDLYTKGFGNITAMVDLVKQIDAYVPDFQFMPRSLHYLLENEDYKIVPRMFHRHDLTNYEALVWVARSPHQLSHATFKEKHIDVHRLLHVGSGWYAFPTAEEAVAAKLIFDGTEIYALR